VPEFDRMDPESTVAALCDPDRRLIVIVPRTDIVHWGDEALERLRVVAERRVGRRQLVAVRSR
jgi:hypothetical protein